MPMEIPMKMLMTREFRFIVAPTARHGFMRCVMPDYDQIDRIEKQLKDIGKHQRHCEKHDFPKQRAVAHIDLIFAGCHWLSLPG